jgi:hypothetical protein
MPQIDFHGPTASEWLRDCGHITFRRDSVWRGQAPRVPVSGREVVVCALYSHDSLEPLAVHACLTEDDLRACSSPVDRRPKTWFWVRRDDLDTEHATLRR